MAKLYKCINMETTKVTLIEAASVAQAERFLAQADYSILPLKAREIVQLMQNGAKFETALKPKNVQQSGV